MKTIDISEIAAMEKLPRVQLATSLPGVKPVALVGTVDSAGHTNLAPFSSIVHIGSNPVLIGMISRPDVVERHTLANITATRSWTINHLTPDIMEQAHHCAARYPEGHSEFAASGLTPHFQEGVAAPFVEESPFRMGLELVELVDIRSNGTKLIVGSVSRIQLDEDRLAADGSIDLAGMNLVASTALDTYFSIHPLARLPYPKPKS